MSWRSCKRVFIQYIEHNCTSQSQVPHNNPAQVQCMRGVFMYCAWAVGESKDESKSEALPNDTQKHVIIQYTQYSQEHGGKNRDEII